MTLDAPVGDVVDRFAVEDLLAVPVVDEEGRLAGGVAVDDVLEETLAQRIPPRRRFPIGALARRLRHRRATA